MGLQNSLHHFVQGPMTTVMTGTVMNWASGSAEKLSGFKVVAEKTTPPKPMTSFMMLSFACGCVTSGYIASEFGFSSCLIPAILVALASYLERETEKKEMP